MPKKKTSKRKRKSISVTFTALVWTGILLAIAGAVVAVLGLGNVTSFQGKIGNIQITTTSIGLVIMIVGSVLAGTIALHLPKDVRVFGETKDTLMEKIVEGVPVFFGVSLIGCVLLTLTLLLR